MGAAEGHLISTTHCGLALSEPRYLPCKTDRGTEIVPVHGDHDFARIRRIRTDKLGLRQKVRVAGRNGKQGTLRYSLHTSQGIGSWIGSVPCQERVSRSQPVVEKATT